MLKITNIEPALVPPLVTTSETKNMDGQLLLQGKLVNTGNAKSVDVGFMYREYAGFAENPKYTDWQYTEFIPMKKPGEFTIALDNLESGLTYEYKAVVRHPKIEMTGDVQRVTR